MIFPCNRLEAAKKSGRGRVSFPVLVVCYLSSPQTLLSRAERTSQGIFTANALMPVMSWQRFFSMIQVYPSFTSGTLRCVPSEDVIQKPRLQQFVFENSATGWEISGNPQPGILLRTLESHPSVRQAGSLPPALMKLIMTRILVGSVRLFSCLLDASNGLRDGHWHATCRLALVVIVGLYPCGQELVSRVMHMQVAFCHPVFAL